MMIFKILRENEFLHLERKKITNGSEDDKRDGFIHFSTAEQLKATLINYFQGERNLILLAVDTEIFGNELRWEISRNQSSFPHLYSSLKLSMASWIAPIELLGNTHILPLSLQNG
jgi:uncharacterized protein (DUF952 family)